MYLYVLYPFQQTVRRCLMIYKNYVTDLPGSSAQRYGEACARSWQWHVVRHLYLTTEERQVDGRNGRLHVMA